MVADQLTAVSQGDFPSDLPEKLFRGEITLADAFGLDRKSLYEIANIAYGLFSSGNLREAKEIYLGLVAADPYDSVFHCHLGAVHHRLGEVDDAYRHYNKALNLNLANVDAMVGRAEIQLARGNKAEGIAALKRAIEIEPQSSRPSIARARALLLAHETQLKEANSARSAKGLSGTSSQAKGRMSDKL